VQSTSEGSLRLRPWNMLPTRPSGAGARATTLTPRSYERGAMAVVVPIVVALLALDIFCLVDLFRAKEVRFTPTWAWAVIILVMHLLGGIGYLILGRNRDGGVTGVGVT
jgi:hypothetical protein